MGVIIYDLFCLIVEGLKYCYTKFSMVRTRDEDLKEFAKMVGNIFDARIKTWEINFKAEIKAEIKASETRLKKELATKDDIKNMATKDDIARLEQKIDETNALRKLVEELRKRLDKLESEIASMKGKN